MYNNLIKGERYIGAKYMGVEWWNNQWSNARFRTCVIIKVVHSTCIYSWTNQGFGLQFTNSVLLFVMLISWFDVGSRVLCISPTQSPLSDCFVAFPVFLLINDPKFPSNFRVNTVYVCFVMLRSPLPSILSLQSLICIFHITEEARNICALPRPRVTPSCP